VGWRHAALRRWFAPKLADGRSDANGGWPRSASERIASASPMGHGMPSSGSNAWINMYFALGDQWALTR
jgi:hypothetical protein